MKKFLLKNIELLTGVIALVVLYGVITPLVGLFYPVGNIPPEMILKPLYWAYEFFMAYAIVWIYLKIVFRPFADYTDVRDADKKVHVDFWRDFRDLPPDKRVIYSIIFFGLNLLFFALIALCGVLS
jgi:hypothetical protein